MQITVLDLSSKEAILIEDLQEELHKKKTIFIVQNTQMETEKKWIQTGNWSASAKSRKKERTVKMVQHTAKKERRKIYIQRPDCLCCCGCSSSPLSATDFRSRFLIPTT